MRARYARYSFQGGSSVGSPSIQATYHPLTEKISGFRAVFDKFSVFRVFQSRAVLSFHHFIDRIFMDPSPFTSATYQIPGCEWSVIQQEAFFGNGSATFESTHQHGFALSQRSGVH